MIDPALLAAWVPAIITGCGAIYIYGRLTEKVKTISDVSTARSVENKERFANHESWLKTHDDKLVSHSLDLQKLHSWHEGYSAGAKTHGASGNG